MITITTTMTKIPVPKVGSIESTVPAVEKKVDRSDRYAAKNPSAVIDRVSVWSGKEVVNRQHGRAADRQHEKVAVADHRHVRIIIMAAAAAVEAVQGGVIMRMVAVTNAAGGANLQVTNGQNRHHVNHPDDQRPWILVNNAAATGGSTIAAAAAAVEATIDPTRVHDQDKNEEMHERKNAMQYYSHKEKTITSEKRKHTRRMLVLVHSHDNDNIINYSWW